MDFGPSFFGRRVEHVRVNVLQYEHLDSLTSCRRDAWGYRTLSLTFARGLRKLVNHQSNLGAAMCLLGNFWDAARRNADRARGRMLRSE